MKCKNPHCVASNFIPVVELKTNRIKGVECENCGSIYSEDEIEIKESVNREGRWNSAIWEVGFRK